MLSTNDVIRSSAEQWRYLRERMLEQMKRLTYEDYVIAHTVEARIFRRTIPGKNYPVSIREISKLKFWTNL